MISLLLLADQGSYADHHRSLVEFCIFVRILFFQQPVKGGGEVFFGDYPVLV